MGGSDITTGARMPLYPNLDYFGAYTNNTQMLDMLNNSGFGSNPADSIFGGNNLPRISNDGLPTPGGTVDINCPGQGGGLGGGYGYDYGYGMDELTKLYYSDPKKYYEKLQELSKLDLNNQSELRKLQLSNNVDEKHHEQGAEFSMNSHEETVSKQVGQLQATIQKNDQSNVMREYYKLYKNVAQMLIEQGAVQAPASGKLEDLSDETKQNIATRAQEIYQQTTGSLITDDLDKYGSSEFTQGLKDGLFGLGIVTNPSGRTKQDNIADITGVDDRTTGDTVLRYTGMGIAGVGSLALAFRVVPTLLRGGAKGTGHLLSSTAHSWGKFYETLRRPILNLVKKIR